MNTTRSFAVPLCVALGAAVSMTNVALAQVAAPAPSDPAPDPNASPAYPQPQPQPQPQPPGYRPPGDPQPGSPPAAYPQPGYPPQSPPPQSYSQPEDPQPYPTQPYPSRPPPPPQYPPPGAAPPYEPPPPPQGHHGLLLMGYIGVHSFQGSTHADLNAGLRVGGLFGVYASPVLSLNGEVSIDRLNFDSGTLADATGARVVLSLSPLFHLAAADTFEVVLGPKLGYWTASATYNDFATPDQTASGYLVGLNAGGFARVGDVQVGGLFSFEIAVPTDLCITDPGFPRVCGQPADTTADKVIAFDAAVLF